MLSNDSIVYTYPVVVLIGLITFLCFHVELKSCPIREHSKICHVSFQHLQLDIGFRTKCLPLLNLLINLLI